MERLRPEDDYFLRCESKRTPMNIAGLQLYDPAPSASGSFFDTVCDHLERRLPATPLSRVRRRAPQEFDSDVWCDVSRVDLSQHVERIAGPLDLEGLYRLVEEVSMQQLDLSRPPFHVHVIDRLEEGGSAVLLRVHHSVGDGIGFQNLMALLTDASAAAPAAREPERSDEEPPDDETWLAESAARFEREALAQQAAKAERDRAREAVRAFNEDPAHRKIKPVRLERSCESSLARRYRTLDLSLERLRAVGRAHGGTVGEAFLAIVSGAMRRYLSATDELPDAPLVCIGARSNRRPEHGLFGNRIMNLYISLATDIEDPALRFAEIRRASRVEIERGRQLDALVHDYDRPNGARARRVSFEEQMAGGTRILPGQVIVSNVPGPDAPRFLAGHRLRASYPAPLLGYGRMLNITFRRYLGELHCGIMSDPAMLEDVETVRGLLVESLEELEARSGARGG